MRSARALREAVSFHLHALPCAPASSSFSMLLPLLPPCLTTNTNNLHTQALAGSAAGHQQAPSRTAPSALRHSQAHQGAARECCAARPGAAALPGHVCHCGLPGLCAGARVWSDRVAGGVGVAAARPGTCAGEEHERGASCEIMFVGGGFCAACRGQLAALCC